MAKRQLRILRVVARMNIGGPAVQITTLMRELPEDKFVQVLCYGECEGNEIDYLEVNNIHVSSIRIRNFGRSIRFFGDIGSLIAIWKVAVNFQPDVIHTHTFKAGVIGRLVSLLLWKRPAVVHTFHGHLLYGYFGEVKKRIYIKIERSLAKISNKLIVVGNRVKVDLLASGIGEDSKFQIIAPGFNIGSEVSINRKDLGLEDADFVCCWVGRLTQIKRPYRVIEIARQLKQSEGPKIKFLVVGNGELKGDLENEAITHNLPINFLGWQARSIDYISVSDVVILTSENEGTPLSLIEAQRLGKPVIAPDVGSVREVMIPGDTGFLVAGDSNEFCHHILRLANNQADYRLMSLQAKEFANSEFTVSKFISKHAKLYEELTAL